MNVQKLKRYVFALALSASFVVTPGLSSLSTVQAQDRRDHRRYVRQDRLGSRFAQRRHRRGPSKVTHIAVGAAVGAVGGALIGGKKGALIGAGAGAGAGYVVYRHKKQRRR
jgi:uncharacterized protein YcfJ